MTMYGVYILLNADRELHLDTDNVLHRYCRQKHHLTTVVQLQI